MASSTVPHYEPVSHALVAVMAQAIAVYPAEEARIRRGAEIVERGGVREPEAGEVAWHIGIYHWYPVTCICPCPDTVERGVARCKHLYAKWLYRKMQSVPPVRSLEFYATLRGVGGIATVYETGRAFFQEDNQSIPTACSDYEIVYELVLGGRIDIVTAA